MHPATTFVLPSAPAQQRKIKRDTILLCICSGTVALTCLIVAGIQLTLPSGSVVAGLYYTAAALQVTSAVFQLWTYSVIRTMRNLQLVLTPQGVTYTSSAGTFSAPWPAVKKVKISGRPGEIGAFTQRVIVHVPGWGGPISGLPMFDRLTIHLRDTGIDANQIAWAVHGLSGGYRVATSA